MNKRLFKKFNMYAAAAFIFTLALLFTAPTTVLAEEFCTDLIAGAGIDGKETVAGEACSEIDAAGNLAVTYTTVFPWVLDEYHLWVGDDIADMPQNKFGSPKLGKFPYTAIGLSDDTPTISITVTVPAADLGVDEWLCDFDSLFVIAHAVVATDTTGDGIYDLAPTAFGNGFELGGKSWALGFEIGMCIEEYFDTDAVEADIATLVGGDGVVGVQVTHNGGNSGLPYFTGQLDFTGDNVGDSPFTSLPFYCVDLANTIGGGWYTALMLSSYDPAVASLPGIINPDNLDKANFILNTYAIGGDLGNGALVTGGDIQRTLWALVFGSLPDPGAYSSGPSNNDNVNAMLAAAAVSGDGYEPPCDGSVAVIIYPVGGDPASIAAQALIAQALVTSFDSSCAETCTVCE